MDRVERTTYRLHVRAAMADAVFSAIVWASPEVARKGLGASVLLVVLLTMSPSVAQFMSLFLAGRMGGIDRRKLLIVSAIVGRLPLLAVFFVAGPWAFLILLTIQAFSWPPIISAWNAVLHANYSARTRGTLYGRASRYGAIAAGVAALGAGIWLDRDPQAYRVIYPLAAFLGVLSCWIFAAIPVRRGRSAVASAVRVDTLGTLRRILVEDRAFRRYEIGFFLYGLAFMAVITAKPIFSVDKLQLSYTVILGSKALFSVMEILSMPLMGRLMDRLGPARLAAASYGLLALHAVLLLVSRGPVTFCIAEGVFGAAMAGVLIAWNMGPVTFARDGDAMRYMAVHVALVGARGLIGHPVGGVIVHLTGDPRWVFLFGLGLWIAGSIAMRRLGRDMARDAAAPEKPALTEEPVEEPVPTESSGPAPAGSAPEMKESAP
ncbi:MAG: MFS transporter [Planctomycetota bacterium]